MADVKVELVKGESFVLQPGKKYLLIFNRGDITEADRRRLSEALNRQGADSVSVIINGNPKDVKLIEDNRDGTTQKRN
jgi:hypothetical protein